MQEEARSAARMMLPQEGVDSGTPATSDRIQFAAMHCGRPMPWPRWPRQAAGQQKGTPSSGN